MATLVSFHAHPDDEASSTGGTLARAADEGHRVVLVVATNGEHGERGGLIEGGSLIDLRRRETERSAEILGVDRIVWLGYRDSGMSGWEQNLHDGSFSGAPLDEAAERLAEVLRAEHADALTVYDWHGNYGHPDHVKVHAVGHRAAELAATAVVWEATFNRDVLTQAFEDAKAAGAAEQEFDPNRPMDDGNPLGTPQAEISLAVDVRPWLDRKRRALGSHASQVTDVGSFMEMPEEQFALFFGTEYFIRRGAQPGMHRGFLFETSRPAG
jgi:LmbE family N-acetylglucosaminyl deacetylase